VEAGEIGDGVEVEAVEFELSATLFRYFVHVLYIRPTF